MNDVQQTNLLARLNKVKQTIQQAAENAKRSKSDITLLAVTKTQSIATIEQAYKLGLTAFGENYLQEAIPKIKALDPNISWHYIGHIQSNKTKLIAEYFSWVHTVDRIKILKRLSEQRPNHLPPLNICFEININNEANKAGFYLSQIDEINACIEYIKAQSSLILRGLMCMPKLTDDINEQQHNFAQMHQLLHKLNKTHHITMDTLSMGTSYDLESAVSEGSTILRIGQAIFGKRG
ncbi:MAG: YggS family pyridoxal phosphate-dependent enzyme [Gammaproteobacteria bacterium]|nr:MAG: YggS family pyridoxal phosphate-dependent enzyme [Gammaproteobacteria bacterium]UTW42714.1 YggS family pyridoxal phosphate-dependent enzyme [bacterium SCSIO 12844]